MAEKSTSKSKSTSSTDPVKSTSDGKEPAKTSTVDEKAKEPAEKSLSKSGAEKSAVEKSAVEKSKSTAEKIESSAEKSTTEKSKSTVEKSKMEKSLKEDQDPVEKSKSVSKAESQKDVPKEEKSAAAVEKSKSKSTAVEDSTKEASKTAVKSTVETAAGKSTIQSTVSSREKAKQNLDELKKTIKSSIDDINKKVTSGISSKKSTNKSKVQSGAEPSTSKKHGMDYEILPPEHPWPDAIAPPKQLRDELILERTGYVFSRQAIASTKRNFVYKAHGLTAVPVVCKVTVLDYCSPRLRENFMKNSLRIMRYVGGIDRKPLHPVFIKVYEIFSIENKIYTFMDEVINADSVFKKIKGHKKISQKDGRVWLRSFCEATQFLHVRGIAHRAIKMDHMLLSSKCGLKMCGWGRSVIYWDYQKNKVLLQKKEPKSFENYHMPPEAFKGPYNPAVADVWALGVLLSCIHTQRYVFNVKSRTDFITQWKLFVKKHRINPIVFKLLNSIFVKKPQDRLTLKQIMEHEYFTANNVEVPAKKSKDKDDDTSESEWEAETTAENSRTSFNARTDSKFPAEESEQAAEPQEEDDGEDEADAE